MDDDMTGMDSALAENIYRNPANGEFPIICWGGFNTDKEASLKKEGNASAYNAFLQKEVADIKECGFNVAIRYMWCDLYDKIQPYINSASLNIIATLPKSYVNGDDDFLTFMTGHYANVKDKSNITGWLLGDEPKYDALTRWRRCYAYLLSNDPGKLIFINLNASSGEENIGKYPSYYSYLEYIQKLFNPQVWSYDLYPITQTLGVNKDFYDRLECFSKISRANNRPFWAFCQCMRVTFSTGSSLGEPTVSRMRFEAFSALAYGAQGIIYWSFLHRNPTEKEKYSDAAIDESGNRTATWDAIKQVNSEIKKASHIFLGAQLVEVKHTGNGDWNGVEQMTGPIGALSSVSGDVLVSHLINDGKNYVVIVNHDPDNAQDIFIHLAQNARAENLPDGSSVATPANSNDFEVVSPASESDASIAKLDIRRLAAGGYVVYTWD